MRASPRIHVIACACVGARILARVFWNGVLGRGCLMCESVKVGGCVSACQSKCVEMLLPFAETSTCIVCLVVCMRLCMYVSERPGCGGAGRHQRHGHYRCCRCHCRLLVVRDPIASGRWHGRGSLWCRPPATLAQAGASYTSRRTISTMHIPSCEIHERGLFI